MSVDDTEGQLPSSPPDPAEVATPQEFVRRLRALKCWSGDLSLRELQRRTGLPRSTIADALDPRRTRLPPLDRVRTILAACGVPASMAEEWEAAWKRIQMQQVALPEPAEPESAPEPAAPAAPSYAPPAPRRSRLLRRPLLLGVTAATAAAVIVLSAYVTDGVSSPVPATSSADGRIGYVGRTTSDEQILSTTDVDLPVLHPVTADDALLVTMMLTSTSQGQVKVTDTAGNTYAMVGDVVDAYWHRTMIFAAFHAKPLDTADRITAAYPKSSKYHIAVDEFRGITAAGPQATASVKYDRNNTAFSTSSQPLPCDKGQLLVSAVGTNSGPAPVLVAGWQTLPELKLSSYRLTTAYQFVTTAGKCAATGTTTAQWEATLVGFH